MLRWPERWWEWAIAVFLLYGSVRRLIDDLLAWWRG